VKVAWRPSLYAPFYQPLIQEVHSADADSNKTGVVILEVGTVLAASIAKED
jgi:hypothetical protein